MLKYFFLALLIGLFLFLFKTQFEAKEPHWKIAGNAVDRLAHQFEKKYDLKLIDTGPGLKEESKYTKWRMSFFAHKNLKLEEVRALVVKMMSEFTNLMYSNPSFAADLKEQEITYKKFNVTSEINPRRLRIKISFWDPETNRVKDPNIAFVLVLDGQVKYYFSNPDQTLSLAKEEPLHQSFAQENVAYKD